MYAKQQVGTLEKENNKVMFFTPKKQQEEEEMGEGEGKMEGEEKEALLGASCVPATVLNT